MLTKINHVKHTDVSTYSSTMALYKRTLKILTIKFDDTQFSFAVNQLLITTKALNMYRVVSAYFVALAEPGAFLAC